MRQGEVGQQFFVFIQHARHVGEHEQAGGVERPCDGPGSGIGVNVVGFPILPDAHWRDDGDQPRAGQRVDDTRVDKHRLAHIAQVEHPLDMRVGIFLRAEHFARTDQPAIFP